MGCPIWLVGMPGSGKSSVAPLVAAALGRPWYDSDRLVEEQTGVAVAVLVSRSEAEFRLAEAAAIGSVAKADAVVATGGGVVTSAAVDIVAGNGVVVWLRASIDTLVLRVHGSPRPLLGCDDRAGLERLSRNRTDLYGSIADYVIDTDEQVPRETAEQVVEAWVSASSQV